MANIALATPATLDAAAIDAVLVDTAGLNTRSIILGVTTTDALVDVIETTVNGVASTYVEPGDRLYVLVKNTSNAPAQFEVQVQAEDQLAPPVM